jgi:hypothetical protein
MTPYETAETWGRLHSAALDIAREANAGRDLEVVGERTHRIGQLMERLGKPATFTSREVRLLDFALTFLSCNLDDGEVESLTDGKVGPDTPLEETTEARHTIEAELHALAAKVQQL